MNEKYINYFNTLHHPGGCWGVHMHCFKWCWNSFEGVHQPTSPLWVFWVQLKNVCFVKTTQMDQYDQSLDPPEIELETDRVHSGENKEAHLTCLIQGNPRPTVSHETLSSILIIIINNLISLVLYKATQNQLWVYYHHQHRYFLSRLVLWTLITLSEITLRTFGVLQHCTVSITIAITGIAINLILLDSSFILARLKIKNLTQIHQKWKKSISCTKI